MNNKKRFNRLAWDLGADRRLNGPLSPRIYRDGIYRKGTGSPFAVACHEIGGLLFLANPPKIRSYWTKRLKRKVTLWLSKSH